MCFQACKYEQKFNLKLKRQSFLFKGENVLVWISPVAPVREILKENTMLLQFLKA